jgi:predicted nucleotidyltransferase
MLESQIKNIISKFLTDKVKFAYLFGSAVTKYFNKNSDIDIAVYLKDYPVEIKEIIDLKYQIEKKLEFKYDIDLVLLNDADLIISNQIITKGEIIINNEPPFTDRFIIYHQSMYFDFKFFRKNLEENLTKKV